MQLETIAGTFGENELLGADEIAVVLGREPGKKWQRKLKRALAAAGISPIRVYVGGKLRRVYRRRDFEDDGTGKGTVRGTPDLSDKLEARAVRNRNALTIRDVMAKLLVTHADLAVDTTLTPRQRFDSIGYTLQYWEMCFQPR